MSDGGFRSLTGRVLWITEPQSGAELTDIAVTYAAGASEALSHLETGDFDAVLATVPLAGTTPELLIEEIYQSGISIPVILHAAHVSLADAVRWTKLGAYQVLQNEADLADALQAAGASRQIRNLSANVSGAGVPAWRTLLIGQSQKMRHVAEIVRLVAPRRCTVLITGETGTGKDVVARSIHAAGNRAQCEMVSVNCSALPENLLEAELFGHVKGAFTGAAGNRVGRFEQAQRSTLFLDEIGDMPLSLQSKLLRVLQEREFQRLGSSETIRVDVRVVAATNANLIERVRQGAFREDLYYRLNVVPIAVPPLRERRSDIGVLAGHFVEKACREEGMPIKQIPGEVMERLKTHDWPGNVRQLENAVEMAVALSGDRRILYPADFPFPPRARTVAQGAHAFVAVPDHGLDFEKTVGNIELNILEQALRKTRGNKKMAAELLGLKRTTLAAKLRTLSETAAAETTWR